MNRNFYSAYTPITLLNYVQLKEKKISIYFFLVLKTFSFLKTYLTKIDHVTVYDFKLFKKLYNQLVASYSIIN